MRTERDLLGREVGRPLARLVCVSRMITEPSLLVLGRPGYREGERGGARGEGQGERGEERGRGRGEGGRGGEGRGRERREEREKEGSNSIMFTQLQGRIHCIMKPNLHQSTQNKLSF